jgi:hypothetical protein
MYDVDAIRSVDGSWRGRVIEWRGYHSRGWPSYTARTYGSAEEALAAALRLRDFLAHQHARGGKVTP